MNFLVNKVNLEIRVRGKIQQRKSAGLLCYRSNDIKITHPNLPLKREGIVRHPELADCELRAELDGKMAKPLQTSSEDPLNASNQAVSGS